LSRQGLSLDSLQSHVAQPGSLPGDGSIPGNAKESTGQLSQTSQVPKRFSYNHRGDLRLAFSIRFGFYRLILFRHCLSRSKSY